MKYKVGDKLRIRQWDDMKAEYHRDSNGIFVDNIYFVDGMKHLCGMEFTVAKIIKRGNCYCYYSEEHTEEKWNISAGMLEPRKEEELYIASDDELNNLLNI